MRIFFRLKKISVLFTFLLIITLPGLGQTTLNEIADKIDSLKTSDQNLRHRIDVLEKTIDDILWFQRVGSVAFIDKVRLTGPPL